MIQQKLVTEKLEAASLEHSLLAQCTPNQVVLVKREVRVT